MRIRACEPTPNAELVVLLPSVNDHVRRLFAQFMQDPPAARPLRVFAAGGLLVGYPPVIKGKPARANVLLERNHLADQPILEAPLARVSAKVAVRIPAGNPLRPLGVLKKRQRRIHVGDQLDVVRPGVAKQFRHGRRQHAAIRCPFALAELLAHREPEQILPAPRVAVRLQRGNLAVGRRKENVPAAQRRRLIDDPFVFRAARRFGDVDLVIVLTPAHMHARRLLRMHQQKRAHALHQRVHLRRVDRRPARRRGVRHEFPLRHHRHGQTLTAQAVRPQTHAIRLERAVEHVPVHLRCVGHRDAPVLLLPLQERTLQRHEQTEARNAHACRGKPQQRPLPHQLLLRDAVGDLPAKHLQPLHAKVPLTFAGDEELLAHKPPAWLQLVHRLDRPCSRVEPVNPSLVCLPLQHRLKGVAIHRVAVDHRRKAIPRKADDVAGGAIVQGRQPASVEISADKIILEGVGNRELGCHGGEDRIRKMEDGKVVPTFHGKMMTRQNHAELERVVNSMM